MISHLCPPGPQVHDATPLTCPHTPAPQVYDATPFLGDHPGGEDIIINNGGAPGQGRGAGQGMGAGQAGLAQAACM